MRERCCVALCGPGSVPELSSWENQQFLMTRAFLKKGEEEGDGTQHSIDRPSLSMRRAFRSALIYLSIASPISRSLSPRPHRLLLSLHRDKTMVALIAVAVASFRYVSRGLSFKESVGHSQPSIARVL